MESKWPFILIFLGLIFGLGFTISMLERTNVMNNWTNRRCDIPVVMAAMFFKPDSDPRSKGDFAKDNFDFCLKSYIEKFTSFFLAPIMGMFGKLLNISTGSLDAVSTIRGIATKLYDVLLGFLDQYYRRFNASVFEMSRIIQFLRMAVNRANGIVVSMLYTAMTLFRGMLNTIQFVIKVVLIICGILLAIIIILIFILFPFIPMIMSVLGAIIATVLILVMVISGAVGEEAQSDRNGFCFSESSKILVKSKDGTEKYVSIKNIKIGQELGGGCGKVTAVIRMDGNDILLHNLEGVYVSGSHVVKGTDGVWKLVEQDERAKQTDQVSKILYCFNTTSHTIPVYSSELTKKNGKDSIVIFRDWEELADNDEKGQFIWSYLILKKLNKNSNYSKWKEGLKANSELPLLGLNTLVKTANGFKKIGEVYVSFERVLDRDGKEQDVLGVIDGMIEGVKESDSGIWNTELFEDLNGTWVKGKNGVVNGNSILYGKTLITTSGEFIIWDEINKKEKVVRDFTDIGHKSIHETYPFVSERLRFTESQSL